MQDTEEVAVLDEDLDAPIDDRVWAKGPPTVPEEDIEVDFEAIHPKYPDQGKVWNRVVIHAENWGRAKAIMRGGKTTTYEVTVLNDDGKEEVRKYTVRDHHSGAAVVDRLFKTYVISVNGDPFSLAAMHPDAYPSPWMTAFINAFNKKSGLSIDASLVEARGKSETP